MIGRFADWINTRRWFIRWLMVAEWYPLVAVVVGIAVLARPSARNTKADSSG